MSIETDITELAGCETVRQSLLKMGILTDPSEQFVVTKAADWSRTGAETFSCVVEIDCAVPKRLMLKACVALSFATSIDDTIEEWIKRRFILEAESVGTPKLFGYGKGMILEEYIPYSLEERLSLGVEPDLLATQLGHFAGILLSLGFRPIQPFADLRSRGSDLVVVDFGEDLGPQIAGTTVDDADCMLRSLAASLDNWNPVKRERVELVARQAFQKALSRQGPH
jgi:hypothetical protein